MNAPGSRSLRLRLTVLVTLLSALLLTLTWMMVTWGSQHLAEDRARTILKAVGSELKDDMEDYRTPAQEFPEMVEELEETAAQFHERLALAWVRQGQVVRHWPERGSPWRGSSPSEWRFSEQAFQDDKLVVALYFAENQKGLARQALVLGAVCFLVVVAAAAGAWLLVGRTLSPIGHLARQARRAGEPEVRLRSPSDDAELLELVTTLNELLERLERTSAARSRFYAAASHELRTPLQALLGHLELALSKPRDVEQYLVVLSEARSQTRRQIRLTRDLLTLNRLEAEPGSMSEQVDLVEVCENEWLHLRETARQGGLQVEWTWPDSLPMCAPPGHLEMVVRNLLENAVKYCRLGGKVSVRLDSEPARLTIFNACEPLPSQDFARLQEPFFRPDLSRQDCAGGHGLGLAIVNAIVERHGWCLQLRQDDSGFQSTVQFSTRPGPLPSQRGS